jgi:hypothetical protein
MSIKENVKSFILWIKDQIDWVKGFFQQKESNKPSMSSVLKLIIIYAWAQSYIKATTLMKSDGIPPISWEWIVFLSAVVGLTQVTDIINKYFSAKSGSK